MSVKKLNLPLAPDMHEALFAESHRLGVPATRLARRLLEEGLGKLRRARQKAEIRQFAVTWAGTEVDLDQHLEQTAVDELLRMTGDEAR